MINIDRRYWRKEAIDRETLNGKPLSSPGLDALIEAVRRREGLR